MALRARGQLGAAPSGAAVPGLHDGVAEAGWECRAVPGALCVFHPLSAEVGNQPFFFPPPFSPPIFRIGGRSHLQLMGVNYACLVRQEN